MSAAVRSRMWWGVLAGVVGAVLVGGLLAAAGSGSAPTGASADVSSVSGPQGLTMDGLGQVYGTPDTLTLAMGVTVTRGDVSAALQAANDKLDRVLAVLRAHQVAKADIQTSGLNIDPQYATGTYPVITGYVVTHDLTVMLHNLTTAGGVVTAAVQAAGNEVRVNGLSLSLASDDTLIAAARDRAFADARSKAQQYAVLAGRSLGKVVSISEVIDSPPRGFGYAGLAAAAGPAASPVPIEAGQQSVDVRVSVMWDFA